MPAKKTTFVATAPDGTEITRTTARVYTHAVLALSGGAWGRLSFNGNEYLATKEAAKWPVGVAYCDGSVFDQVIVVPVVPR